MNKLVASSIIGLMVVGGAIATPIIASAHDKTPCSTALLTQTDLEAQVKAAIGLDTVLSDAQAKLVAANVELAAAIKADNDTKPPLTKDSDRTVAAKAAVAAATTAVAAAKVEADKTNAVDLRVKLAVAVKIASGACKGADGTVTPTPTTVPTPQVVVIPRAIDTGEA